jgi:lipoate-protein ligase A
MKTVSLRFLDTGTLSPFLNMAIDEALLIHHERGENLPTLRVFRWSEKALSVGRFQNVEEDVALNECVRLNVIPVRRPTGGRAVYHEDDITYSFVGNVAIGIPSGILPAYAFLSSAIRLAFSSLHVTLTPSTEQAANASAACFASSTVADIVSSDIKLVGSAQVWKGSSVLQQGSIPLHDHADELFTLLAFSSEIEQERSRQYYKSHAPGLIHYLPSVSSQEVVYALQSGFAQLFKCELITGELTTLEWETAQRLAEEKYAIL